MARVRAWAGVPLDPSDGASDAERPASFRSADFAERATGKGGAARVFAAGRRPVDPDLVKAARIISLSVLTSSSDSSIEMGEDVPLDGLDLANLAGLEGAGIVFPPGRLPVAEVEEVEGDPLDKVSCSSSAARRE